ncbi:hypothetical protein PV08_09575 [Exophiala spinifera]|uniref:Uncharacterized protein n=1 Tax=Exophiala spinifera TaxID=91928 RepID=A0A0D2AZZ3_9EURO|nr:uncharacterized protein PV08_09575 [Exophiala spinifera]KIW12298.1 hypothetical protein PV08_09575 [Exophiala spinifera]
MSAVTATEAHDAADKRAFNQAEAFTTSLAHVLRSVLRLVIAMPQPPYILSLLSLNLLCESIRVNSSVIAYFKDLGNLSNTFSQCAYSDKTYGPRRVLGAVETLLPEKKTIDLGDWSLETHGTSNFPRKAAAEVLSAIPGSQGFCLWPDGSLEVIMLPGRLVEWYRKPCLPCLAGIRIRLSQLQIAGPDDDRDTAAAERTRRLLIHRLSGPTATAATRPKKLGEVKSHRATPKRYRILRSPNIRKWRFRNKVNHLCKQIELSKKAPSHPILESESRPGITGVAFSSPRTLEIDTQPLREELTRGREISQLQRPKYRDATVKVVRSSENSRHNGGGSQTHISAAESEAEPVPAPAAPELNGAAGAKRTDSGTQEANGFVQGPRMGAISLASTPPEDVPLPPTPPPAESPEDAVEPSPSQEVMATRWIASPCNIRIGTSISTAGVKVRQANSTEQFVTISTHAAYEGCCKKPLPYCKPKSRKIFSRNANKPLPNLVGVLVQDASRQDVEVGKIFENTDVTFAADDSLVFPNEFPNNVSLVGPLSSTTRLAHRAGLVWSERINPDGVSLRILGDNEQAESFAVGTYFDSPLPVKHGKEKLELSARDIHRSLLYRRNGKPPQDAGKFRGAPVVLRDAEGKYKEVIGFEGFHFKPMHAQHENLRMDSKDVMQRIITGHVTTIYGAIKLTREFKRIWQIVDE